MPFRFYLQLAAFAVAVTLSVALVVAWRADRHDRAQLAAELAVTKQLLTAADARQKDRDAQLAQTLAQLAAEKRATVTPAQILRELPRAIPLPAPVTLQTSPSNFQQPVAQAFRPEASLLSSEPNSPAAAQTHDGTQLSQNSPNQTQPNAIIPGADLKPLYDFAIDCQACQAKLSAAQHDLLDERQKTAALTKERDDALRVVKGGTTWRRVARAAKWFVIGAAAGAIAAKSAH